MNQTNSFEDKLRPFFIPLILGAASIAVFFLLAFPRIDQLKVDAQNLSDRQKFLNILQSKLTSLNSLDENSQLSATNTVISALPLSEPFHEALLNLDALINRHQINISQIKVESFAESLNIKFSAAGPLSALKDFIADANRVLPISTVTNVEAAKTSDIATGSAYVYHSEVSLKIFFSPPPKSIGRPSDPLPIITDSHLKALGLLAGFEKISPAPSGSDAGFSPAPRLFPE